MPLEILLPLVAGGIGFVALLLHLLGYSRQVEFENEETARQEWLRHFPETTPRKIHLAKTAVLIETDRGLGLLRAFGADTIAHKITSISPAKSGLIVDFSNFSAPPIRLDPGPEICAKWLAIWRIQHG